MEFQCNNKINHRLKRYEEHDLKKFNKNLKRIAKYSIEIDLTNEASIKDSTIVKGELWSQLDDHIHEMYLEEGVFDIQLATNEIEYINLLQRVKLEEHRSKSITKIIDKNKKDHCNLKRQQSKIDEFKDEIAGLKSNQVTTYPIKCFATFTSIEVADYIMTTYNKCCCRCCYKSKDHLYYRSLF